VAQSVASKILSNANIHLVSMDMPVTFSVDDASGLCWRFSGEILSTSKPCLITILAEGRASGPLDLAVKVNSEDTVFALNLLNRVVAIIDWGEHEIVHYQQIEEVFGKRVTICKKVLLNNSISNSSKKRIVKWLSFTAWCEKSEYNGCVLRIPEKIEEMGVVFGSVDRRHWWHT
jgi:hypothetical protein